MVKEGTGPGPEVGDKVSIDWEGYTIGYYGRPFETRNKVKGGAFDSTQTDFFRWVIGDGSAILALDNVVKFMKEVWYWGQGNEYIMSRHITTHDIASCHIGSHRITSHYTTSHNITLRLQYQRVV